jgi:hypothetical protein
VIEMTRDVPVPEPDAGFEERIWARQRADLVARGALTGAGANDANVADSSFAGEPGGRVLLFRRPALRSLATLGSIAAAIVLAFVLGVYTAPTLPESQPEQATIGSQQRSLLIALGGHLERTRRVLVEVSNARIVDVSTLALQQRRAGELIADNRLYRQSAAIDGLPEYAALLEEIERVLLELARGGADSLTPGRLEWLQTRIGERDLLFRSRVLQTNASERPAPAAGDPVA